MTDAKASKTDKITSIMLKVSEPLSKFAARPVMKAIQNGLVTVMPLIIIGSLFLIVGLLGTDSITGSVLVPFLEPYASKLTVMNSLTMGFLSIYCAVAIPMAYAEQLGESQKTCAVLGLAIFFTFTLSGVSDDGSIPTTAFSSVGLFAVIISSLVGTRLYKFIVDRHITINMPDSVPPAVGESFTSLIPFGIVLGVCWIVRTLIDFDFVAFLQTALTPFFTAADNIGVYTLERAINAALWAIGLHGESVWTTPIFQPFMIMWTEQNSVAKAAGEVLPHIWTLSGVDRISTWPALVWPLVALMITSKVKYLRALGIACLPAAFFGIVEPVIFGLPVALNPFLFIPFVLTAILVAIFSYGFFALGLCAKFFVTLPWAMPVFLLGPLGTGDLRTLIIIAGSFLIGLLVYLPFWRAFEAHEIEREREKLAKKAARAAKKAALAKAEQAAESNEPTPALEG